MNQMMIIFLIVVLGYWVGSIKVAGLQLGSSAVLIIALFFGHYGLEVPSIIRELGLISFVTAVGFIAGPVFFKNFKEKALSYIFLGILVIFIGAASCIAIIKIFNIPTALAVGMLSGALTSTPGLAAAIEASGDTMASVGYGIAYPFGVVGVVLFIQLVPKFLKINLKEEVAKNNITIQKSSNDFPSKEYTSLDSFGFFPFAIAAVIGLLIASIKIPLPGGISFSLGTSGGPLLIGLVLGHVRHIGKFSISVPKATLETLREFGLILFLMGAGTNAGQGFIVILQQYGLQLFFLGALMTLLPMIISYIVARRMMKLDILNSLGSICGGMTSTPALGTLISVSGTDAVAASYAATYPIALICVVLTCQFLSIFL
jgi:putative transport protein